MPDNWSGGIDELVEEANLRLAQVLPADRAARPKDEVNARLVRHYTTQGLLPAPWREGREARYDRPHLLQLLALRRLMADGLSGKALYAALEAKSQEQLTELAELGSAALGGLIALESADLVQEEANPALRYLQSLKRKAAPAPFESAQFEEADSIPVAAAVPRPAAKPVPVPAPPVSARPAISDETPRARIQKFRNQRIFRQVEVEQGLELQVASDFDWPQDELEWQLVLQEVREVLEELQRSQT